MSRHLLLLLSLDDFFSYRSTWQPVVWSHDLSESTTQTQICLTLTNCCVRGRRHTLSRRRIIPLPQWKANPETDPEALFGKDQLVLALYPQTTCFYRALIHTPPHRVRHAHTPKSERGSVSGRSFTKPFSHH